MGFHPPKKIAGIAADLGEKKTELPLRSMLFLGFLGGAFISLGFLLDIRVIGNLPENWGSFGTFLGAAVFPLGLILVVIAGAELVTGNMMAVSIACLAKKVTLNKLASNWFWITISNFIGAIFVAYVFGHLVGLTEHGPFLDKTIAIAQSKVDESFWQAFFSAIGCNWLVGLGMWLSYGSDEISGKILAIWFPIMAFVAIGFQHVVANMFLIPAAIFAGHLTWFDYIRNFIPVFLGNVVGGSLLVGFVYWFVYLAEGSPSDTPVPGKEAAKSNLRLRNIREAEE
ncbi:formate/nitrite transporter family protein [Peribacillus saganii]|uniref:Formate/nitrite transporter family protein n=1 Tax=Peribacillus saganii TaxID=2303992 RepID=A0A372LLG7_9BACI|nr:formate/nitrite transporter family protein [Peribacillus saganii]RFU67695.1 formate/nitrite transporter family protein [Peribacillus saganii]